MANIDTTTKPMVKHEDKQLKAIFQASDNDPYANLLWESNRIPFSNVLFTTEGDTSYRYLFDPETKEWNSYYTSVGKSPKIFTRDFDSGRIGYYSYNEQANSLYFYFENGGTKSYPASVMPSSFLELCKSGLSSKAIWGRKDCSITYYTSGNNQYIYDGANNNFKTFTQVTTTGYLFKPSPGNMWALGDRLFHSNGTDHYEFKYDTANESWIWDPVTFYGKTNFSGDSVWSDGDNTYCRETNTTIRQLDQATLTWSAPFEINVPITIWTPIFTDGHSCYMGFKYDSEKQEFKYYEWDKYHKMFIQKTGSNLDFGKDSYTHLFIRNNTLVENYGNWGTDQEPYKESMWATNGSIMRGGTTFYAKFWPNENNSYREINNG